MNRSPRRYISSKWVYGTERWLLVSVLFHISCSLVLIPVASHPYDLAVLTGNAQAWLKWGFSPLYNWKFGLDYVALAVLAQALRAFLAALGVPGIIALHVAWKLPLVAANLLSAGAIYRLALKLAPGRAVVLASLWLVSPVVLWVSAGHGQVESLAILCVFAALYLALDGRLITAGLVTGLGVGIEYFPIAVLGAVVVWWRGGQLTGRKPLLAYGAGLSSSLVLCFVPVILDPVGRLGLGSGLVTSSGLSSAPIGSLLSVWGWLDYRWANAWPFLFGVSGLVCLALAWRFAKRGPAVGILFVAIVLILAVLLDVNALALFALIAGGGLWLLAMVFPVQPLAMIALPVAGSATALLFLDNGASTANAYFFDEWATTGVSLWPVPQSEQASIVLGHLFSLGLIATIIYAAANVQRPSPRSWTAATALGSGLCLLLVIWASQPVIWQSALGAAPTANLPDFDPFVANRAGKVVNVGPDTLQVSFPDALVVASHQSEIKPSAALHLSMQDLFARENVGIADAPLSWSDRTVTIPGWDRLRLSIQSLWVEVLVGSPAWSQASPPKPSDVTLEVNQTTISSDRTALIASRPGLTSWAVVDFRVPSTFVHSDGRLELLPHPVSLLWNGSKDGPWVRIVPAVGTVHANIDLQATSAMYELNSGGQGYMSGLPLRASYRVIIDDVNFPPYQVYGAVLRWPDTPDLWMRNPWIRVLGAIYGAIVILATTLILPLLLTVGRERFRFRNRVSTRPE